jgi:hypothetical protein
MIGIDLLRYFRSKREFSMLRECIFASVAIAAIAVPVSAGAWIVLALLGY